VRHVACVHEMIWTDPPPSRVILLPPSRTMCTGVLPVDIGGLSVDVTEMVTGSGPQLNVTIPPPLTALDSAWNVQLGGVPVPTTVVGWLLSTGCASAGNVSVVQEPVGFPATGDVPEDPVPLEAPDSLEGLPELAPPLVDPEPTPPPLEPPPFDPLPLAPAPIDPLPVAPAPIDPLPPDPVPLNWAPLEAPLDAFAPPTLDPLRGLLSEPVPSDEAPALWPEAPFASEPVPLPQPMASATQRENESRTRFVRIAVLASKGLPSSLRHLLAASFCTMSYRGAAGDTLDGRQQPSLREHAPPVRDRQPARPRPRPDPLR
jgi:hypothetical protein